MGKKKKKQIFLKKFSTREIFALEIMAMNSPFGDVAPPFWQGGPDPSGYYQFPHANRVNSSQAVAPNARSQYPITVGTSVFGLKYKDGVIIAADTMGNYGRLSRYPNLQRVNKINETTVLASSGDIADFQYLNTIIVGGIQDGKPFLGCVDYIGTAWKENAVATGMGAAMAIPIINHELEKYDNSTDNLNFEQAREIMMKCLRVSYLRDCRATNKFHISVVNKDGAKVEGPLTIDSNWEVAKMIKGYD